MKNYLFVLCAIALVFGWTASGVAVPTYNEPPVDDAMVDSLDSGVVFGLDPELWVQGHVLSYPSHRVSYLKFDLSSIPDNAQILSAEAGIHLLDTNPVGGLSVTPEITLHRVGDDSWSEGSVTYASPPNPTTVAAGYFGEIAAPVPADYHSYVTWDLLGGPGISWGPDYAVDLADDYISLIIQPVEPYNDNYAMFSSKEGTHPPYLAITYTVIPAPGAVLLGCIGSGLVIWLRRRRAL